MQRFTSTCEDIRASSRLDSTRHDCIDLIWILIIDSMRHDCIELIWILIRNEFIVGVVSLRMWYGSHWSGKRGNETFYLSRLISVYGRYYSGITSLDEYALRTICHVDVHTQWTHGYNSPTILGMCLAYDQPVLISRIGNSQPSREIVKLIEKSYDLRH